MAISSQPSRAGEAKALPAAHQEREKPSGERARRLPASGGARAERLRQRTPSSSSSSERAGAERVGAERDRRGKRQQQQQQQQQGEQQTGDGSGAPSETRGALRPDTDSKTALEIAANEGLFGAAGSSSGAADDPWHAGLLLSTTSPLGDDWGYPDDPRPATQYFRSPFVDAPAAPAPRRASASADGVAASASASTLDAPSKGPAMGNYDRDYHLRMQMQPPPRAAMAPVHHHPHAHGSFPQQQQQQQQQFQAHAFRPYAAQVPQDHARSKGSAHATSSGTNAPYFHQLLDADRRGNNMTQAAMYVSTGMTGGGYGQASIASSDDSSSVKRARGNSVASNNPNNSSYLPTLDALPYGSGGNSSSSGYQSPTGGPAFDPDHPLPDFSPDWFVGRISPPHHGSTGSASTAASMALPHPSPTSLFGGISSSHVHITAPASSAPMEDSSSGGGASSRLSGLPSPNGMFNVDALLPDYESSLYSLWNSSATGSSGLGYDNDNDQGHQQNQHHSQQSVHHSQTQKPASPHMYISAEDELKMDYPGLSEFNQGELDYLYDPMESGGPSPTTPLGTTGGSSMSKLDHYSSSMPRGNNSREPYVERAVGASDYLKRDHPSGNDDAARMNKKARPSYGGSFDNGRGSSAGTGFRSMARNATIEAKRPSGVGSSTVSQGYQSGGMGAQHALQQQDAAPAPHPQPTAPSVPSSKPGGAASATTPTSSGEGGSGNTSKRPRSRQCDFPGCTNRARSHQKCKKHGGAHQCVFDGCTKNSQSRGLCIAHGGGSRCKVEGCVRAAQSKGLCKSHGGGEFCAVEGCRKKAHLKHLCRTHGGGVRCKFAKCSKWAQRKGWCMAHAKEFLGS